MPEITGSWMVLDQATFEQLHPVEGHLHFRETDAAHTAVRSHIASLGATQGWPLTGIFISGVGECPHFALHVSEFPTQIGGNREEKLQNAIDAMLSDVYEDVDLGREDPDDPVGDPGLATFILVKCHVWRYDQQHDYAPRLAVGVGDYALSPVFSPRAGSPPADWWRSL